jgi:hypothetical protein
MMFLNILKPNLWSPEVPPTLRHLLDLLSVPLLCLFVKVLQIGQPPVRPRFLEWD